MPGMAPTMDEFKAGTLRSGSKRGSVVTNPKQAIAIGLSEARKAGQNVPQPPRPYVGKYGTGGDVAPAPAPNTQDFANFKGGQPMLDPAAGVTTPDFAHFDASPHTPDFAHFDFSPHTPDFAGGNLPRYAGYYGAGGSVAAPPSYYEQGGEVDVSLAAKPTLPTSPTLPSTPSMNQNRTVGYAKGGNVLSAGQRKALPRSAFAVPSKAPGSGSYPMPDRSHAANAKARASQFGSPAVKAAVNAKAKAKFGMSKGGGVKKPKLSRAERVQKFEDDNGDAEV